MSTVTVTALHACDAAYLLHKALGPVVAWTYWLVDGRRGIGAEFGCRPLTPIGKLKDQKGYWRPAYKVSDLVAFIEEFKEKNPGLVTCPLKAIPVETDPADLRTWRSKRLAPLTKPTKMHRASATTSCTTRMTVLPGLMKHSVTTSVFRPR